MASMYDTLRDLPFFKGSSPDQISAFLERTHLTFNTYSEGDTIINPADRTDSIRFVMAGEARVEVNTEIIGTLAYSLDKGRSLGALYLYGMSTDYPDKVVAATSGTSIMEFSKAQFLNLLESEKLFLVNYLNYLALHSQRPQKSLRHLGNNDFKGILALCVNVLTPKYAQKICVEPGADNLMRYEEEIKALEAQGLIKRRGLQLLVSDRHDFIIE